MTKQTKEDLVGTAVQLAFEYPEFNHEHISDMYNCCMRPKFTYDDLGDYANLARHIRNKGLSYSETITELMARVID